MATPKQTDPQFKLRMTPGIKEKVEQAATASGRSMNAEILYRLERSFDPNAFYIPLELFARIKAKVGTDLVKDEIISILEAKFPKLEDQLMKLANYEIDIRDEKDSDKRDKLIASANNILRESGSMWRYYWVNDDEGGGRLVIRPSID